MSGSARRTLFDLYDAAEKADPAEAEGDDVARSIAEVDRWLARQARRRPRDWHGTLSRIRNSLEQLCAIPLLSGDAQAEKLLADLACAADMEDFNHKLDRLGERVAQLCALAEAARSGTAPAEQPPAPVVASASATTPRAPVASSPVDTGEPRPERRAGRTVLRL